MKDSPRYTGKNHQLEYHRFKGEVPSWVEEAVRNGHTWDVRELDYIIHATTLAGAWEKVFRMKEFKRSTREPYVDEGGPSLLSREDFTRIIGEDVELALDFLRKGEGILVDGGPETEKPLPPERLLSREELQERALKCKRDLIEIQFTERAHYLLSEFSEHGAPYAEDRWELELLRGNTAIEEWHLIHFMPREETVFPETLEVYGGFGDYLVCTRTPIEYHWTYDRVNRGRREREIIVEVTEWGEYFIAATQDYFGVQMMYGLESPYDDEAEESHVRVVERWRGDMAFHAFHRMTGIVRKVSIPYHESHGWWFKLLEADDGTASEEEWQQRVKDNHPS
ncbi:MAG: hypothetical protein ACFFCO_09400 [Promethearchaeota archaeon]